MEMPTRLSLQVLRDDLAYVEEMLRQQTDPNDTVTIMWRNRRDALRKEIATLASTEQRLASIALIFSGDPVVGSQEIRADFAAKALESYQNLISTVFADHLSVSVSERGRIPHSAQSKLYLREIIHGSMGFVLGEITPEFIPLVPTALKETVDKTSEIINKLSVLDVASFEDEIEKLKPRVIKAVQTFTKTLDEHGAETRIVGEREELSLNRSQIRSLHERLKGVQVDEEEERRPGILDGVLPERRTYEFTPDATEQSLSGTASDEIIAQYLANASAMVRKRGIATFRLIRTIRSGSAPKEQRFLESFEIDADA